MKRLKKWVRWLVPKILRDSIFRIQEEIDLVGEYLRDWLKFRKNSGFSGRRLDGDILLSNIMIDYHRLEKGFSLREPRPGFGRDVYLRLIKDVDAYLGMFPINDVIRDAIETLEYYNQKQRIQGALPEDLKRIYTLLLSKHNIASSSLIGKATEEVHKEQVTKAVGIDYERFLGSRHSVRDFSDEEVDLDLIAKAIDLAKNAPSVCNRQAWFVHVLMDPSKVQRVLEIQRGALSFKNTVKVLLVLTTNQKRFVSAGERNQQWVDGGIFLMSLTLAIHSLGLGGCCLNWCGGRRMDRALSKEIGLKGHEAIIAAFAVGHLPEKLCVAKASKLATSELFKVY